MLWVYTILRGTCGEAGFVSRSQRSQFCGERPMFKHSDLNLRTDTGEIPVLMNTYTYDWFKQNVFRKQKHYAYFSVTRKHTRTHNYGHSLLCNRIYQVATFIWSSV